MNAGEMAIGDTTGGKRRMGIEFFLFKKKLGNFFVNFFTFFNFFQLEWKFVN